MADVVPLREGMAKVCDPANEVVITFATDVYLRAKRGEFVALAVAAVHANGVTTTDGFQLSDQRTSAALAGSIADVQHSLAIWRRSLDVGGEALKPAPDDKLPEG